MARKELSATNLRNLRTLLLLNVFEPEEIGARIQQARERAGLRQEDLADLIDLSTRQVQNYEAGDSKPFGKLKEIAVATGVTIEWLLHGDESEVTPTELASLQAEIRELRDGVDRIEAILRDAFPDVQASASDR